MHWRGNPQHFFVFQLHLQFVLTHPSALSWRNWWWCVCKKTPDLFQPIVVNGGIYWWERLLGCLCSLIFLFLLNFCVWRGRFPMGLCCCFFKVCFAMCSVMIQIYIALAALQNSLFFHFCLTVDFCFSPPESYISNLSDLLVCFQVNCVRSWSASSITRASTTSPPLSPHFTSLAVFCHCSLGVSLYLNSPQPVGRLGHIMGLYLQASVQWGCPWFRKKGRVLLLNWALDC